MRWGSRRYHEAIASPDLLQPAEAARRLGVSLGWLRKNLEPTEWHHANLKYGGLGHFYAQEFLDGLLEWLEGKMEWGELIYAPTIPKKPFKDKFWKEAELRTAFSKARMRLANRRKD